MHSAASLTHPEGALRPEVQLVKAVDGTRSIVLSGCWTLQTLKHRIEEFQHQLTEYAALPVERWDLSAISAIDQAGGALLWRVWGRRRVPRLALNPEHERLFAHLAAASGEMEPKPRRAPLGLIEWLGSYALAIVDHILFMTTIVGQLLIDSAYLLRKPALIPWREISANVYRTGTQALGITALVGFLIGVVLSYLSAQQLKLFGADVFIINILGISVLRELGPVLAAILIAGRSGSAITAQLGVMRVTQELDAMQVMGISYTLRLILPKLLALAISLPLIILWTDAIALLGGMVAARAELGFGYGHFVSSLPDAVPIANLWLGLGKGVVFGLLIALVACHFGLRIAPNTESLGSGTTNSVVTSITIVIIVDAIFAILFKDVGIS